AVEAQKNDRRDEQQLVGKWIENDAQLTALVEPSRDEAVQAVAGRGDAENYQRHDAMHLVPVFDVVEDFHDKKRDKQDAEDRDFVRRGHERNVVSVVWGAELSTLSRDGLIQFELL